MTNQKYETYEKVLENLNLKINGCDIPECPKCGQELSMEDHQVLYCIKTDRYGCGWIKRFYGYNESIEIQKQNKLRAQ